MIFKQLLAHTQMEFEAKYELSATIRHKGERGKQRENGLLMLLRENLPLAYGVATGEIFPYKGGIPSPQCDIMIYDQLHYPIFGKADAVQQVPLEAVYCVIEVKSILDSGSLEDFHNKTIAISKMPRCDSKTPLKKNKCRKPYFILFAYRMTSTVSYIQNFMTKHNLDWIVAALNAGIHFPIESDRETRLLWIPGNDEFSTLAYVYWALLEALETIDLGAPDYLRLMGVFD